MGKVIQQTVQLPGSPTAVYDALMDEKKHAVFTGSPAQIDNTVGGTFKVWDDYATGENLILEPGKKIVQKWHAADWPQGHMSTVTYLLSEKDGGTQLSFTQENVPDDQADPIADGWDEFYWKPLSQYLLKKHH